MEEGNWRFSHSSPAGAKAERVWEDQGRETGSDHDPHQGYVRCSEDARMCTDEVAPNNLYLTDTSFILYWIERALFHLKPFLLLISLSHRHGTRCIIKIITQPVHKLINVCRDILFLKERHHTTFSSTTYTSSNMEEGSSLATRLHIRSSFHSYRKKEGILWREAFE